MSDKETRNTSYFKAEEDAVRKLYVALKVANYTPSETDELIYRLVDIKPVLEGRASIVLNSPVVKTVGEGEHDEYQGA